MEEGKQLNQDNLKFNAYLKKKVGMIFGVSSMKKSMLGWSKKGESRR